MMQLAKIWTRKVSHDDRLGVPDSKEAESGECGVMHCSRIMLREDREAGALSEGSEALRLARKALSIVESCRDSYSKAILPYLNVLLRILGDPNAETDEIFYQMIAITAENNSVRLPTTSGARVDLFPSLPCAKAILQKKIISFHDIDLEVRVIVLKGKTIKSAKTICNEKM